MHRFAACIDFVLLVTVLGFALVSDAALGAAKPHVVSFGKWTPIKWCVGPNEAKCLDLKVRPCTWTAALEEFTLGASHEITERLFVVRRAFRVNDSLPGDTAARPRWVWQRGGWLLVDRMTGHVSAISSAGIRFLLFGGQLVSRLCCLLRRFR